MLECDASNIPFPDEYFDLITSNLGINNFENPEKVLSECHRVLKTNASICLTTNLTGTFSVFYVVYKDTLHELGLEKYLPAFMEHVNHRGTEESVRELLVVNGFLIKNEVQSTYTMRFLNGTTFLNHTFIILGFINSWRNMFDETDKQTFFDALERNLNAYSKSKGELKLTIPLLYLECIKK